MQLHINLPHSTTESLQLNINRTSLSDTVGTSSLHSQSKEGEEIAVLSPDKMSVKSPNGFNAMKTAVLCFLSERLLLFLN